MGINAVRDGRLAPRRDLQSPVVPRGACAALWRFDEDWRWQGQGCATQATVSVQSVTRCCAMTSSGPGRTHITPIRAAQIKISAVAGYVVMSLVMEMPAWASYEHGARVCSRGRAALCTVPFDDIGTVVLP
jgi:hypothetical protein